MEFDLAGISALAKIAVIDLVLSGDNAVVIALAVRALPPDLRRRAIMIGTVGAIAFRLIGLLGIVAIFGLPYVRLLGGVVLVGIAIQLLIENPHKDDAAPKSHPKDLRGAIMTVMIADAIMSLDNLVGIVAAAGGKLLYVVIGFLGSIPLLMVSSHVIADWLGRYRILVWASGALLGWVSGELMLADPVLEGFSAPSWIEWGFPAATALLVLAAARLMVLRRNLV